MPEAMLEEEQARNAFREMSGIPFGETIVGPMAGNSQGEMEFPDEEAGRESLRMDHMAKQIVSDMAEARKVPLGQSIRINSVDVNLDDIDMKRLAKEERRDEAKLSQLSDKLMEVTNNMSNL